MEGKFLEASLEFPQENVFRYGIVFEGNGRFNGAVGYIILTCRTDGLSDYAGRSVLIIYVRPPELTGKPGEMKRYYYPMAMEALEIMKIRPLWTIVQSLLALRALVGFSGCRK